MSTNCSSCSNPSSSAPSTSPPSTNSSTPPTTPSSSSHSSSSSSSPTTSDTLTLPTGAKPSPMNTSLPTITIDIPSITNIAPALSTSSSARVTTAATATISTPMPLPTSLPTVSIPLSLPCLLPCTTTTVTLPPIITATIIVNPPTTQAVLPTTQAVLPTTQAVLPTTQAVPPTTPTTSPTANVIPPTAVVTSISTVTAPDSSTPTVTSIVTDPAPSPVPATVTDSASRLLLTTVTDPAPAPTTFSAIIFITTTDSLGREMTTAPMQVTVTSVESDSTGGIYTTTVVGHNPTLGVDKTKPSPFFSNTAAVASVFSLAGLVVIAIALWIFFALRRRRRREWLDGARDIAASSAGFARAPLDDEDDDRPPLTSLPVASRFQRPPSAPDDFQPHSSGGSEQDPFSSFTDIGDVVGEMRQSYLPARSDSAILSPSPPPAAAAPNGNGHRPSPSYEPLLAAYYRTSDTGDMAPSSPPRSPVSKSKPPLSRGGRRYSWMELTDLLSSTFPEPPLVNGAERRRNGGIEAGAGDAPAGGSTEQGSEEKPILSVRNPT